MKQFNIQDNDITFVSIAGTALNKGWQCLVKAASRLNYDSRKRIKIIIAGNPPRNNIIEKYVNKLNMQNNVVFVGFVDDVRELISITDIGFVLSQNEALSIACREMMAMGKPVLVSSAGGLPENVNNRINGWVIEQKTTYQIQKFLQKINKLDLELERYSHFANKKAKQEFGLVKFINSTIDIYRKVEGMV